MSKKTKLLSAASSVLTPAGAKTKCHTGNVRVMGFKNGAGLFCGGWTRGAESEDMAVIDLTGTEPIDVESPFKTLNSQAEKSFGKTIAAATVERQLPWLSFKIKDFGTPTIKREVWDVLATDIWKLMSEGSNVLLACAGGHGRTGTAASILCYLLNKEVGDPVEYLRNVYCELAVETYEQHKYVNRILDLPEPKNIGYKHDIKPGTWQTGYWQDGKWHQETYDYGGSGYGSGGSSYKYPPPLSESVLKSLTARLDEMGIDFTEVLYTSGNVIEVGLFSNYDTKTGLTDYEVVEYEAHDGIVALENIKTRARKSVPLGQLAKKAEVETYYASLIS